VHRQALIATPAASPFWEQTCPGPAGPVTLTIDTPVVKTGTTLRYRVTSPSGSCVTGGGLTPSLFYVHPDGRAEYLQPPGGVYPIALAGNLAPGYNEARSVFISPDARPGHYLVSDVVKTYITDDLVQHTLNGEFTVVP
jgi:hypothetical protein